MTNKQVESQAPQYVCPACDAPVFWQTCFVSEPVPVFTCGCQSEVVYPAVEGNVKGFEEDPEPGLMEVLDTLATEAIAEYYAGNTTKLSNFVREHVAETLYLSAEDSRRFAEVLLDPPEPSETMRQAAKKYKEFIGDE